MFDFNFTTFLYFIIGVVLVLILLHNLSRIFHGRVYEYMKTNIADDEDAEDEDQDDEDAEDEDQEDEDEDIEYTRPTATGYVYYDDEGPIPNYSDPVDENTIDSILKE